MSWNYDEAIVETNARTRAAAVRFGDNEQGLEIHRRELAAGVMFEMLSDALESKPSPDRLQDAWQFAHWIYKGCEGDWQ